MQHNTRKLAVLGAGFVYALSALAADPLPGFDGPYRMECDDVFYGPSVCDVTVRTVADSGGVVRLEMLGFPFVECAPTRLEVRGDSAEVIMPNNQHILTDEDGAKLYLQYVDPKIADDFGNYAVTDSVMVLDRDPLTGVIAWNGGDFVENVGWGHFVVLGADYEGYLCFINRITMTPVTNSLPAVPAADTDTASEQWYTLSGIRISAPEQPGLYVCRRGAHARLVRKD